ncbi:MAG: chemotaxis protein CheD [Bacteroidales bacterium]|nr:chemotaxis protein CheD [Bacteroidales bacterium]
MSGQNSMYYLYPAALYASTEPMYIHTILGSCVAICLWDSVLKIGGMNHYMLPLWNGQGLASPKYGNIAVNKLYEKMIAMGSSHKNLKAKIFGGSDVLGNNGNFFSIGERNIEIAKTLLHEYNLPVISSDLGGQQGRKIRFYTYTGEVNLKYIDKTY